MFFAVILVAILAGISPGPDFVVVTNNTVTHGKRAGIATALGVAAALAVHATYSILGLTYLLVSYHLLFQTVQIAGAVYLAYLAVTSIVSSFRISTAPAAHLESDLRQKTNLAGFRDGLLCNLLNPKAYVFFLSIFSQFMTVTTPPWVEWIYGLEVVVTIGAWFVLVAVALSTPFFRHLFLRLRKWIERLLGVVLLTFAGKIATAVITGK